MDENILGSDGRPLLVGVAAK